MRASGLIGGLRYRVLIVLCLFVYMQSAGAVGTPQHPDNPHYSAAGFFDMHVCDWPNQPVFFMGLFSTTHFHDVKSVEIVRPDGKVLGWLNLDRYRVIEATKRTPEKHVFIKHFAIPRGAESGWYTGRIEMKNGREYIGRDYVIWAIMPRARGFVPADGAQNIPLPHVLRWDPIPGAAYYRVFITDLWQGKLIYDSGLHRKAQLVLPKGLIQPGGYYSWRVHARDVDGHILLGDFNDGSLSRKVTFTVADSRK